MGYKSIIKFIYNKNKKEYLFDKIKILDDLANHYMKYE